MSAALKLKLDFFTRAAAALEFNLKEVKEEGWSIEEGGSSRQYLKSLADSRNLCHVAHN